MTQKLLTGHGEQPYQRLVAIAELLSLAETEVVNC